MIKEGREGHSAYLDFKTDDGIKTGRLIFDGDKFKIVFGESTAIDISNTVINLRESVNFKEVTTFEKDVELQGDITFTDTFWNDLRFTFTQSKLGANAEPNFDETNVGLLFPQNDTTEIVYIIAQLPHAYKLGTNLKPHIHWQQSADTAVVWKMDYKWFENGDAVPANFTTIASDTDVFTYTSGDLAQISSFPEIDGSGVDGISSMLLIKVYRDDNTTTGDVLGFELDIHYQINSIGSSGEFNK